MGRFPRDVICRIYPYEPFGNILCGTVHAYTHRAPELPEGTTATGGWPSGARPKRRWSCSRRQGAPYTCRGCEIFLSTSFCTRQNSNFAGSGDSLIYPTVSPGFSRQSGESTTTMSYSISASVRRRTSTRVWSSGNSHIPSIRRSPVRSHHSWAIPMSTKASGSLLSGGCGGAAHRGQHRKKYGYA